MSRNKYKIVKVGSKFYDDLIEIKNLRQAGIDRNKSKALKFERITDAFTKTKVWQIVKKEVIDMPRAEEDRR